MHKVTFYLVIAVLLFSAGCAVIDENGIEGAQPDAAFGPASLAGMWKGESNWDGTTKEIKVWVRKPTIERMISPTGQAPTSQAPFGKLGGEHAESPIAKPSAGAPAWEQVKDTGLVFWGWDIFIKGSEKINFVNVQIIFKEDGQGKLTVVSQTGGTGNAIFVQEGGEKRVELALFHPLFKEINGRFRYEPSPSKMGLGEDGKINGSFTLVGKEGIFKLTKDNFKPAENQPE